jgi:peptidoglycan/LPS O-acetylase OafA/YrhL
MRVLSRRSTQPDSLAAAAPGADLSHKLRNVQALRAVAAYMVVFHHVVDSWNNYAGQIYGYPINLSVGTAGVDIFFLISGFIMVHTNRGGGATPAEFLGKRIARVVPLYWLLSLAAFVGFALGFKLFGRSDITLQQMLSSLFFIPTLNTRGAVTEPPLFVGWTLNYEMFFYLVFSAQLAFRSSALRALVVPAAFGCLGVWALLSPGPYVMFYGSTIVWEFYIGMLLATHLPRGLSALGAASGWAAVGAGAALLVVATLFDSGPWRGITCGLPASLIVFGALQLERSGRRLLGDWWRRQGDASYSIYLSHPFVLQLAGKSMIATGVNLSFVGIGMGYAASFLAVSLVGTLLYRHVEAPLEKIGRRCLGWARSGHFASSSTLARPKGSSAGNA